MKKFLTLVVALVMVIPMMAIGRNDGSTKANAIDFSWDSVMTHPAGTKWYHVDLAPLYEEETPALNLFLANKDAFNDANTSLKATVAGQTDEKSFTIHPKQQRVWSANATMLIRLKQKEIYLTLTSDREVKMSARVFEAQDLDETCTDALYYNWSTGITKPAGVPVWYKVNITEARKKDSLDVCVVVKNEGTSKLTLHAGQSLDCPSSGVTRRTIELEAGATLRDTIPNSALSGMAYDELFVSLENNQPISVKAEYAKRPKVPVMPAEADQTYVEKIIPDTSLHKNDTTYLTAGTTYYFKYDVKKMNALKKYEPEFTFRNKGAVNGSIERKMAFEVAAYVAQGNTLELAPEEESVEVLTKNTLIGLEADYIFVKMTPNQDMWLISRFKHVREGKACKTNIDFNWEEGHRQDALTTQWYAIDLKDAKASMKDLQVYVENQGAGKANLKASLAFSCPYIDVQEVTRSVAVGDTAHTRLAYSTYAMMSDTIYIGLETNQEVKFWVELTDAKKQAVVDSICLQAKDFSWEYGDTLSADTTMWFLIDMKVAREKAAKFPTIFVQNESATAAAKITAELSLECPDSIENQKRSITIAANGSYSKTLSSNMFSNIKNDTIYLKVRSTQKISMQIRLTDEAEGTSCASAIPFNWTSGNNQKANDNLWYKVDLRQVGNTQDLNLTIENKSDVACTGAGQLTLGCPDEDAPSVQNFSLAAHEKKTIFHPHSILWLAPEDSIIYINLQGSASLHIAAERVDAAPFTPITGAGLTLDTLLLDTTKFTTQSAAEAWYLVPKEEVARVLKLNENDPQTPVIHLENNHTADCNVTIEAAFGFPVEEKMISQTINVAAGTSYTHTLDYKLFMQAIRKYDSIIVRINIPAAAAGKIRIRSGMDQAYGGNTRQAAIPVILGKNYTQSPNTEMWYKLKTADIKKDKTLFNKQLYVNGKNAGKGDAKVNVEVYEGLLSEEDLLEAYGLNDYRERTIKKGQGKSHNVPAQVVYAVADVELYIKIRTTDSLVFETKFVGEYKPQTPDPKQQEAKLVVPNVDYVIPGDNQEHWYMVCVPYINANDSKDGKIKRNYKYVEESYLHYELSGKATIEATATFQDTMNCKMPVRKRTINKSNKNYVGDKPLRELIERGLKKAGHPFDFSGTAPEFIDSLLHRFITQDSITGYVRVKSDKEIKVRLNTPQITGDRCDNAMMFDWEHGNVNAKDSDTWYQVVLINPDSTLRIPDTCDIRIHVDNWSDQDNTIDADLFFDCNESSLVTKHYVMPAGGKDSIDVDRDRLELIKANMLINFQSTGAAHIWAELIDTLPRKILRDTIDTFVCYGTTFIDTVRMNYKEIIVENDTAWIDTLTVADGVAMIDSLTHFYLHPITNPEIIKQDSLKKLNAAPLLVQGMQLYVKASNDSLMKYYQAVGAADSLIDVDTVYWAKPVYKTDGSLDIKKEAALDLTKYYTKTDLVDTLLLVMKGGCEQVIRDTVVFTIDPYKYVSKKDTVCPPAPVVNPDTIGWQVLVPDTLGRDRQIDTIVSYYEKTQPALYAQAQISLLPTAAPRGPVDTLFTLTSLKQQFEADAEKLTMKVTDAKWQVQKSTGWSDDFATYTVPAKATSVTLRYIIDTECGVKDTSENVIISVPCENDTIFDPAYPTGETTACDSFYWAMKDTMIYTSDTYYFVGGALPAPKAACKEVYQLTVTINHATSSVLPAVEACDSLVFQWVAGVDTIIKTPGTNTYKHTYVGGNSVGCDSVVSIDVTIHNSVTFADDTTVCDEFRWVDAAQGFDTLIITPGTHAYTHTFTTVHNCDSVVTMTVTVHQSAPTTVLEPVEACLSYTHQWVPGVDTIIDTKGTHTYTHMFQTIHHCDSLVSIDVTIYKTDSTIEKVKKEYCNLYEWVAADTIITETGSYYHTYKNIHGCDSVARLDVVVNGIPYVDSIEVRAYYGYRIIMINRNQVNSIPGWTLDSLHIEHPEYVNWHSIDLNGKDEVVGNGYYYNLPNGEPLPTGYKFYATIDVPASVNAKCGVQGKSQIITIGAAAAAPALVPSLAKPGEDIQVVNLDPTAETLIRIYTAEGLLQKTYKSSGETSFTIKAASDLGFYLVELSADNMKSTLRYIVK